MQLLNTFHLIFYAYMNANAFAIDFGVLVTTDFFSPTKKRNQGMKIGMSISNYELAECD